MQLGDKVQKLSDEQSTSLKRQINLIYGETRENVTPEILCGYLDIYLKDVKLYDAIGFDVTYFISEYDFMERHVSRYIKQYGSNKEPGN